MLSNRQLIHTFNKEYPDAKYGDNYWVGTSVDSETKEVSADAMIIEWNVPNTKEPTEHEINVLVAKHEHTFRIEEARERRNELLNEFDNLVKNAFMLSDYTQEQQEALKNYRQQLRDITKLPNFPNVDFPVLPV